MAPSSVSTRSPSLEPYQWNSDTLQSSFSQSSWGSADTQLEPSQTEPSLLPLRQALSSTWTNFLGAHQSARELATLKDALNGHINQTNGAIKSLKEELARERDNFKISTSELRSNCEQIATDITEIKSQQSTVPILEREVKQSIDQACQTISELDSQLKKAQGDLQQVRDNASQDINSVRDKYGLALENIEFLHNKLNELRAERAQAEDRISSLELQLEVVSQACNNQKSPSEDAFQFLDQLIQRRQELMALLSGPARDQHSVQVEQMNSVSPDDETQAWSNDAVRRPPSAEPEHGNDLRLEDELQPQLDDTIQDDSPANSIRLGTPSPGTPSQEFTQPDHNRNRKKDETDPDEPSDNDQDPYLCVGRTWADIRATATSLSVRSRSPTPLPPPRTRKIPTSARQDILDLYRRFTNDFHIRATRGNVSDADLIWDFIESIDHPLASRHIQESLAALLPQFISVVRTRVTPASRNAANDGHRYITISPAITWGDFMKAFALIRRKT